MNPTRCAARYQLLIEEIERRMSTAATWATLPGLLDELDALRRQLRDALPLPAATRG